MEKIKIFSALLGENLENTFGLGKFTPEERLALEDVITDRLSQVVLEITMAKMNAEQFAEFKMQIEGNNTDLTQLGAKVKNIPNLEEDLKQYLSKEVEALKAMV